MMPNVRTTLLAVLSTATLALGACGSSGGGSAGDSSSSGGSKHATAVKAVSRAPICPKLDEAKTKAALTYFASGPTTVNALEPGQKYTVFKKDDTTSTVWSCRYDSSTKNKTGYDVFVVSIQQKPTTETELTTGLQDALKNQQKYGGKCTLTRTTSLGHPSHVLACHQDGKSTAKSYADTSASMLTATVVGTDGVRCYGASARDGKKTTDSAALLDAMTPALAKACQMAYDAIKK